MKIRICAALLIALLLPALTGCSGTLRKIDAAEEAVENRLESAENAVENAISNAVKPTTGEITVTEKEAMAIALEHAGFDETQVKFLRAEFELEKTVAPHYDVSFLQGQWEYEYEIDAQTGEVLSFERDD